MLFRSLWKYGQDNFFSRLKTLFAFTGIEYCFFSGETPEKSGLWFDFEKSDKSIFNNFFLRFFSFNKKLRNYLGALIQLLNKRDYIVGLHNLPRNSLKFFDSSSKKGLWDLDFFKKRSYVLYKWPFFIEKDTEVRKSILFRYEDDSNRLKRLLSSRKKDVYYVQLMQIDKIIHKYGKKSARTKEELRKIDKVLENFIKKFNRNEIIIWSDHGFADIKEYIDIEKMLPKRKDFLYFIAGTSAHFWFNNNDAKKEVLECVKKIKGVKILDKKLAKNYKIPLDRKYGDLFIFIEKGRYFFPNFYQGSLKERFVSMHGYPDNKELDGFFLSNKSINKKDKTLKMKDIVDILR